MCKTQRPMCRSMSCSKCQCISNQANNKAQRSTSGMHGVRVRGRGSRMVIEPLCLCWIRREQMLQEDGHQAAGQMIVCAEGERWEEAREGRVCTNFTKSTTNNVDIHFNTAERGTRFRSMSIRLTLMERSFSMGTTCPSVPWERLRRGQSGGRDGGEELHVGCWRISGTSVPCHCAHSFLTRSRQGSVISSA